MKAVVLVGGFGTRLRPLTLTRPKQMLPVLHRPMIEVVLERLAGYGITEAVLSLGYRPDTFRDAYPDGTCAGVALHYAVEPEPLDTAGAIRFAARHAGIEERFVVVNGDILTDLDLTSLLAFHERNDGSATIALHKVDDPSRYGVVPTHEDGKVIAFVEKPPIDEAPSDRINAGTYVLEPEVLDRIPDGRRVSIERETFPDLVADGQLYALDDGGVYWLDLGTPATLLQAQLDLMEASGTKASIHPTATVHPDAVVERSVIGAGCQVGPRAEVRGSLVGPGCSLGAGSVVDESLLGWDCVVGAGASVRKLSVLGDGEVVADSSNLVGELQPAATA